MNEIIQFCQSIFGPTVIVFTVANLFSMGLQVEIPRVIRKASNPKFLLLILIWGWVIGPVLAYLINFILPLEACFTAVIFIACVAPCAPFVPPAVDKARGDVDFAGAVIPLAAIGTVVFMPLLIPLMVKGVSVNAVAIAKPLIITVLIPLLIGALIRTYAAGFAGKIFKPFKVLALLTTAITTLFCILIYARPMLELAGSFAFLSLTLFMVIMGLITYRFGFGFSQSERSVMSLAMGSRNIAAVLIGVLAIPNVDQRSVAMVVLYTLWSVVLAFTAAAIYGKIAAKVVTIAKK